MTIEELRVEAKKLGYNLIPINKKEKLLPCTCGCKRREHWGFRNNKTGKWETELRCHKCGKTVCGPSEKEAIHNWNEVIKKEMKSFSKDYPCYLDYPLRKE